MNLSILNRSIMTLFSVPDDLYSHQARLVLSEKDIACDIEDIDPDNLTEDVLHLNPYHTTPMLVDRDLVLYDARVVIEYLDERFPHPPLMPIDPISRARTRVALYRIEKDWMSLVDDIENGGEKKRAKARKDLRDSLIASSELFTVKPFFLSDELSILDTVLAPMFWRLSVYGIELAKTTAPIHSYAQRMFDRQGFQDSLTLTEQEMHLI